MCDMEGEAGRAQTRVPEQQLDAAQVDPGFEQMRRKRVALIPRAE